MNCRLRQYILFALVIQFLLCTSVGLAQGRIATINKTNNPPIIDGSAIDSAWQTCDPQGDFVQYDPYNGNLPKEKTLVKMAFDRDNLYILFECYDSEPQAIAADLTPREGYDLNDYFSVILDTYYDKRTSYHFEINPKGVQMDEPGDYTWESAAMITDSGWTGELRIPFKSIRFPEGDEQKWGINFERYIFRLKETDYFTPVGRDDIFLERSAVLEGLHNIKGGKNLELFPYAGIRHSESSDLLENKFAYGLDVKYALTSSLNIDLSASPDYSEMEADPFFYQLTPYEYRLNEQRPFFQEGNRYLTGSFSGLFYSKRINNPKIAAKVTGKQGKYTIGAIGAINKEKDEDEKIGAVRIKRDILKYSSMEAMVSGYDNAVYDNLNYGFGTNLQFSETLSCGGQVQVSTNKHIPAGQNAWTSLYAEYDPDEGFNVDAEFVRIPVNYAPQAGIYGVRDVQIWEISPGYKIRLNELGIRRLTYSAQVQKLQTSLGSDVGYSIELIDLSLITLNNFGIGGSVEIGREKEQLEISDDQLAWSKNYFENRLIQFWFGYTGNRYWNFDNGLEFGKAPVYASDFSEVYDGQQIDYIIILAAKPLGYINLELRYQYNLQKRREDKLKTFEGSITRLNADVQITRHFHFKTILSFDSNVNNLRLETLLGYELGMGNKILFSYKTRGTSTMERFAYPDDEMTLSLKASWLIRI